MGLTLIEKLATRHAEGLEPGGAVRAGDFITIRPRHVMTHDNTAAVIPKFTQIHRSAGRSPRIHDPRQPVFAIDHDIQNKTPENLGKYAKIESFAREHQIDFYPAGTGISHQVMVEQGYVVPGSMVVGSDSHSNLYGAACCLGTPVVRTDAACIWATGRTWWQVPPVARVILRNQLRPGVVGKDVIVALCGLFNRDEVLNHAVEFTGDGVATLSVDERMSIANMSTEWGALAGVFPFDERLREYLLGRAEAMAAGRRPGTRREGSRGFYTSEQVASWWAERHELAPDDDARYAVELELDLASVVPHVSGPNDVKTMVSLPEIEPERVKIDKAWLMSCVNARYEDLAAAASVVRGRKIAEGVEFYLAAASAETQARAEADGHWGALLDAGATPLPPGCGTCIGLGAGTIRAGEVGISSTNRNFEGRMGDREGLVYLGSPAVVAASAVAGYICAPAAYDRIEARASARLGARTQPESGRVAILDGFPPTVEGRALLLDRDNMNTDGIYAGKHTYNESLTPEDMAGVIFENYDPAFRNIARPGDIVVSGLNFGTGSSREQAVTALKHFGIRCVVTASVSETYKRNAFNNGFAVLECPSLVEELRGERADGPPEAAEARTRPVGSLRIDHERGVILYGSGEYPFAPLSPVAQELIVAGGAEALVAMRLSRDSGERSDG